MRRAFRNPIRFKRLYNNRNKNNNNRNPNRRESKEGRSGRTRRQKRNSPEQIGSVSSVTGSSSSSTSSRRTRQTRQTRSERHAQEPPTNNESKQSKIIRGLEEELVKKRRALNKQFQKRATKKGRGKYTQPMKILRGIYEHHDSETGGPFVSYIFDIKDSNEVILMTGFVNYPGHEKLILVKELEIMFKTIKGESI